MAFSKSRFTRYNIYALILLTITAILVLVWNNANEPGKEKSVNVEERIVFVPFNSTRGKQTSVDVFTFLDLKQTKWTQDFSVNLIEDHKYRQNFFSVPLNTPAGALTVFIHNPQKDGISSRVKKTGQYEPEIIKLILQFIGSEKDISFIDVGANIGLHTAVVAKFGGRNALAIEMIRDNIQHLCMTAEYNNLQSKIKVIFNALGSNHAPSKIITGKDGRSGGGYVNSSSINAMKRKHDGDIYNDFVVKIPTVMLDDLLTWKYIHRFNKHFLKMDVEGGEASVIEGALKFLKMTRVTGILMEWRWHRERANTAETIISIMQELNFNPFQPVMPRKGNSGINNVEDVYKLFTKKLKFEQYFSWPHDVLWLPSQVM